MIAVEKNPIVVSYIYTTESVFAVLFHPLVEI